ncbi:MAG: hypothetical protein WA144_12495 [Candidatus Methanoperedens sp.]
MNLRIGFHESRILGEKLLRDHKISWEEFSIFMLAFEDNLRRKGDDF